MSDDNVLFSFIIPTFNRAHSLPSSIESIIQQSSPNWELIVVDDGSSDNTSETTRPYLEDDRINYIYQENRGVSAARNFGVANSNGEFLIFLDSDDRVNGDLIERLNEIIPSRYDMICWEVERAIDDKKFIQKPANLGKLYNGITAVFLAGSVCYKRKLFIDVGGYDDKITFGENFELGLRISEKKDLKIMILDKPYLFYSINSNKRTSNNIKNKLESNIYQYQKHKDKYKRDKKAHSLMNYLIGYSLEKSNNKVEAIEWYKKSWRNNPMNLKPMIKLIYLNLF